MKHHKLNEIPEEHVTSLFSRRFFTGENITMAFLTLRKGCIVPRHQHDSEQFSYCISGSLHFNIGGEEVILRAGEMVEIPPNVPHEAVAAYGWSAYAVGVRRLDRDELARMPIPIDLLRRRRVLPEVVR